MLFILFKTSLSILDLEENIFLLFGSKIILKVSIDDALTAQLSKKHDYLQNRIRPNLQLRVGVKF